VAFQIDPESAHNQSMTLLSKFPGSISTFLGVNDKQLDNEFDLSVTLNDGNNWSFPIGLAAGLDKNAEAISFFSQIPFGAVEVGTVTPRPQEGNPKPRMFRLVEDESLLNRMGFNNDGADKVLKNILSSDRHGKVLGVNLGKNKATPADKAHEDYQFLYSAFAPQANYLVVNVSSPNTPGLRDLQNIDSLKVIFDSLKEEREKVQVPLYLKVSPDLSHDDLPAIVKLAVDYKLSGIIATNTTVNEDIGVGGVSGKLALEKSRSCRNRLLEIMKNENTLDLIGVGGISEYNDLIDFWKNGGKVCQIYTSFIYKGPAVLVEMKKELEETLKKNQLGGFEELLTNIGKVDF